MSTRPSSLKVHFKIKHSSLPTDKEPSCQKACTMGIPCAACTYFSLVFKAGCSANIAPVTQHYGHPMCCMHLPSLLWLLCKYISREASYEHACLSTAHLKLHALYGYSTALCLLPQRGCLITACDSQVTREVGRADRLPLHQHAGESASSPLSYTGIGSICILS